jgi:hypothetical protein
MTATTITTFTEEAGEVAARDLDDARKPHRNGWCTVILLRHCSTPGGGPASPIVVGNRGLGVAEGEVLGSIPAAVVRDAKCDVLIVQVSQGEPGG